MAQRTVTTQLKPNGPLQTVSGEDIPISESTERWSELKLEDGSTLRVKPSIVAVTRVPGAFDPEGNPIYVVQGGMVMVVSSVGQGLKQE
jgi:hypothetical protein